MSSSKECHQAVKKLKSLQFSQKLNVKTYRAKVENTFTSVFLPNRVDCNEKELGGVNCDVIVPELFASNRVLLYVHGGSFVAGSKASWRAFCAAIANATACRTIVPEYRLAPAHPYPSALEDVQAVFRALYTEEQVALTLKNGGDESVKPEIIIMADGSGASIALALLFSLKGLYRQSVSRLVLLSPWLDVSSSSAVLSSKKSQDEVLTGESINRCAEYYTYLENRDSYLVSPLKADESMFKDFPPVYIQMGEHEILLEDAKKLKAILEQSGGQCVLDVWEGMMHMFQFADEFLSESHLAVEKIGKLITVKDDGEEVSDTNIHLVLEQSLYTEA